MGSIFCGTCRFYVKADQGSHSDNRPDACFAPFNIVKGYTYLGEYRKTERHPSELNRQADCIHYVAVHDGLLYSTRVHASSDIKRALPSPAWQSE